MSSKPWYSRYPRDFRAKTLHLNLMERGAYDALIDHYFELGAPPPNDPIALYRIAGAYAKAEQEAVDRVVKEFFFDGNGLLCNARCDEELEKMRQRSAQQSDLAKRRWEHAKAMPSQSQGNASHSHSHSHSHISQSQSKTSKTKAQAPFVLPDWVPRHQWDAWIEARVKARKAPTNFAMRLAVNKLVELEKEGHHPAAVLAQSAFNGWSGLFAIKEIK